MATRKALTAYIAKELRRHLNLPRNVKITVGFTEDEQILARIGQSCLYVHGIMGDDDEFSFTTDGAPPIRFPIPLDLA